MNDLAASPRLSAADLVAHAQDLRGKQFALECVWAIECAEGMLLVHDFFRPEDAAKAQATSLVPHGVAAPSIAHIFPGAAWHERETADMLAMAFTPMDCLPLLLDPATAPGVLSRPPADRPSLTALGLAPSEEAADAEGAEAAAGEAKAATAAGGKAKAGAPKGGEAAQTGQEGGEAPTEGGNG